MIKLNINIKINKLEEIKPIIEYVNTLNLNKIPEFNSEITVEFGYNN